MSILIIDEPTKRELILNRALVPVGSSDFEIRVPLMGGTILAIPVQVTLHKNEQSNASQALTVRYGGTTVLTDENLRSLYKNLLNAFPTTDAWGNYKRSRTLRSDPGGRGLSLFIRLVRHENFDPYDIIAAVHYDVYSRKKSSVDKGANQLSYMKSTQSWLNDSVSIQSLVQTMQDDTDFIRYLSGEAPPETGSIFVDL